MKPTQTLPENYELAWTMNLKSNLRLNILLNLAGVVWMVVAGLILANTVLLLRPDFYSASFTGGNMGDLLVTSGIFVLVVVIVLMVHELVHGFFFWVFSGHKPEFGFGPGYAYAAMPDWFYPRQKYLVIGLSPLVLMTLFGLAACMLIRLDWLGWLLIGLIFNAGGAIGDIYVCWRIAREKEDVWIKDTGDGFQLYRRRII